MAIYQNKNDKTSGTLKDCKKPVTEYKREGESKEAPLHASFLVLNSERKVAFESDDKDYFEVLLPAGEYTIVPDNSTPIPFPGRQKKTVTVPEDGFAVVTLRFDTGMR